MLRRAIHPVRRRPANSSRTLIFCTVRGAATASEVAATAAGQQRLSTSSAISAEQQPSGAASAVASGLFSATRVARQGYGGMAGGGGIPGMPNMGGGGAPGLHGMPGAGGQQQQSPYGVTVPKLPGHDGKPMDMGSVINLEVKRRQEMGDQISARFVVEKDTTPATGRVIGIDLGTTNSCISYIDKASLKPKIIPSPTGSWVFPTAITFDKGHQVRVFGEEARACARTSASSTLCSGKRLIGRRFGELGNIHSQMSKTNVLTITEKGEVAVEIMGRTYSVIHVTAMFLRYLKGEAEKYLGEPVSSVVVSVPAYFTPQQKIATEDAALAAGFDVWEVIDEPSAACLTYTVLNGGGGEKGVADADSPRILDAEKTAAAASASASAAERTKPAHIKTSLVFDLGGGTLDCALMEHDTQKDTFTLVATHGDPMLGGNDWDAVLSHHIGSNFEKKWGIQIEDPDGNAAQGVGDNRNLLLEAERCKIHFTHSMEVYNGYQRGFHFSPKLRDIIPLEVTLTFSDYLSLTRPLRERCLACVTKLFEHSGANPKDIDHILLVGAMTRDPPIKKLLEDYFGRAPESETVCPADYSVAIGAAIRAGMLEGLYPHLSANTKFVKGTVQRQRSGGSIYERATNLLSSLNPFGGGFRNHDNPNAIGQRWRGVVKGLTDEEIMNYAKEMVEFEAAQHRRELLERAEDEANRLMGRVAKDSSRRQGMQERRVKQLADQLKFWQYMVHNFHDHEEELKKTVVELEEILDELDGVVKNGAEGASKDADKFTASGTIKFGAGVATSESTTTAASSSPDGNVAAGTIPIKAKTINRTRGSASAAATQQLGTNDPAAATPAFVTSRNPGETLRDAADKVAYTAEELADGDEEEGADAEEGASGSGPKILRRNVPLTAKSSKVEELIEAGHAAFINSPVPIPEKTRSALFRSTVEERAWHEPPAPPGESGSWQDVKKALDEGMDVGLPVPVGELVRPMSCEEMLEYLQEHHPLDYFISPQHAEAFAISCVASEMAEGVSPGVDAFVASMAAQKPGAGDDDGHGSVRVGTV